MKKNWQIPRRTFLKGLGTAMALPLLEAMAPVRALAGPSGSSFPKRMAFVYIPNGVIMEHWTPKNTGPNFDLPYILQPLKPIQNELTVFSGFAHEKARANGDGAGDHARANATFLTGVQARKTAGADIRLGISVDQVAAQKMGKLTRFPSLELSCDRGRQAGSCDSGYSCAYQYNLAWKSETTPLAPENDPRLVFERLFASGHANETKEARARRQMYQKSLLDFVMEDAHQLQKNLGANDRRKMDEYLTAVRELELQIERAEKTPDLAPNFQRPSGIPPENAQHIKLMFDLMTLAFQTDSTRISTFLVAHDGSNKNYPALGVTEKHHTLSHHQGDQQKKDMIAKIDHYHSQLFAYFLQRLKATPEGEGNLLDNCMIVYGGGISDGNRHTHHDLPIILAGKGGGTIRPGRHVKLNSQVPLSNLFLSMLDRMGAPAERFGDSTGRYEGLV